MTITNIAKRGSPNYKDWELSNKLSKGATFSKTLQTVSKLIVFGRGTNDTEVASHKGRLWPSPACSPDRMGGEVAGRQGLLNA